ncbi:hypothetical protein GOODEAATRI_024651 [Goodea atripinnis]|uniref:Uncharacterized protein n=1 Tax=Goodea atripinnis TaxID=208336 RepID=A0ABV0PRB9_9TELE
MWLNKLRRHRTPDQSKALSDAGMLRTGATCVGWNVNRNNYNSRQSCGWVAYCFSPVQSSHNMAERWLPQLGTFHMELACFPCACVGSLWVLWLLPIYPG